MTDTTHEGNDPMGALTTHRGPLEACPAPECQDRVIEQQEDAEPTATVAGQSIALHVSGFPDVPNRWGSGYVRVDRVTADPPAIPDGPIEAAPVGFRPTAEQAVLLRELLAQAGVELGPYDERIVAWLASWDWATFAPIASLIKRAAKLP